MPKETGEKLVKRDENGRVLPGSKLNPNGRPAGVLNFATKFNQAIEKLAEKNDITGEELELQILQMGIKKAREGDYSFYRDTFDRVYGKPQQSVDVTTLGESVSNKDIGEEEFNKLMATYESNKGTETTPSTEDLE